MPTTCDLEVRGGRWHTYALLRRARCLLRDDAACAGVSVEPAKVKRHIDAAPGYVMQVCSRCDGSGVDPEIRDCTCDCCGGTGEEEVPDED